MTLRPRTAALAAAPLCVLLAPTWAFAAASPAKDPYGENTPLTLPADTGPTHADTVGSGSSSLVRTFIGLAVVVAIIYGLTWVLRQVKAAKEERTSGTGLASEATLPLGPGRSVHLIRAGRELVLVGSAEHGVVPLRTYSEDEARALGLLGDEDATPAPKVTVAARGMLQRLRDRTVR